jgi:hypothetical protein
MERRIQTFKAAEKNGTEHTIQVILGYHEVVGEPGQTKMAEDTLMEMRTEDGRFVQPCEGGFEIIDGTERIPLTSNDPNAPG